MRIEKINSKFHISWGFSTGAQLVGLLWLWRYTGYWAEDNTYNHVKEDEVLLSCFEDPACSLPELSGCHKLLPDATNNALLS